MAYHARRSRKISREELLTLVGAGAMLGPGAWREDGNGAYTIFDPKDLDFIRDRSVKITRRHDGAVRVDVLKYGKPTI